MSPVANKPNGTGLGRIIRAFGCSVAGFRSAYKHESAFRQEVALFVVMVPLGYWFGHDGVERALLIGTLFLVLITELLNSAVEAAVDRISNEHHPLSGRAKDIGSAAVFLALSTVVVVWALVLLPRFWPVYP
ncbi:diacylglycerol kinase [Endothiovibrio diazotrophicus]